MSTLEKIVRRAAERLRNINGYRATSFLTADAKIDADGDGVRDEDNPDTGAGSEAGVTGLRVPLFLGVDKPAGEKWTPEELEPDNLFDFTELDARDLGFQTSREIVDHVVATVAKIRAERAAADAEAEGRELEAEAADVEAAERELEDR